MNLLTRLGQRFDAVETVNAGALVFTQIGAGSTATDNQHHYSVADRDAYTGV
ncbi:hypothetical protein CFBP2533_05250 [Xanthomonas hortorum pv. pelargonii]|uniref:Uncharacterized protein n=1 Tax=Xanthomonas hortorum pv. pelargonii TaxID=453602 RepID=A0A6V7BTG6_9XANT|nr:hypothetical protein CFBP2533_05250 [Xanthomonas hortorum pv. pelargonii]CAD0304205.1 hypothetical protein CFBP2533_05250 [Xanthomonas hortorum pv. pelargonii]